MTFTGLASNLWKYAIIQFTNRRNFLPILSVYFLTLPDTHANQIGIYMGIGYLVTMIFQVPTGVLADHWGQKNSLIISRFFVMISTLLYIVAGGFFDFILAGMVLSLGNVFSNGASGSFLKGTLEKLGRGGEYRYISSKISGNISFLSILFIILLPFLTKIDIRAPFYFTLVFDVLGFLIALLLVPVHTHIEKHAKKSLLILSKELSGTGFFSYAFFVATISGFLIADNAYRSPYLIELGYPMVYIGLVMGGSRLVWWMVGHSVKQIEKYIPFQRLILIEIFIFPLYYFTTSYFTNPWLVGIIFSVVIGWFWGRSEIYTDHLFDRIPDARYRATALSLKSQIENTIEVVISFGIAGVMGISYASGFQTLGVILFLMLVSIYWFGIRKTF